MTLQNVLLAIIMLVGVFCTAVAHSIFIGSLKHVKVQTAGIISGMETVYGILFAFLLLGEAPGVREIIGGAVILISAFLASRAKAEKSAGNSPGQGDYRLTQG